MNATSCERRSRTERFVPRCSTQVHLQARQGHGAPWTGVLRDISPGGLSCTLDTCPSGLHQGGLVEGVQLGAKATGVELGVAHVIWVEPRRSEPGGDGGCRVGLCFLGELARFGERLRPLLNAKPYVTDELRDDLPASIAPPCGEADRTLLDFYRADSPDLFAKCRAFHGFVREQQHTRAYQTLYRITLTSGIDHRITVFNPLTRREQEMICFDSNSYLGLHRHPRVLEAVERALRQVGYGTPSAQLLCGTNRYLRELEQTVSEFHDREDCIVFSSGYAANVGTVGALVRHRDLVARDEQCHASLHDGAASAPTHHRAVFPHDDMEALEALLSVHAQQSPKGGALILTDGVFSMHGSLARLPELVRIKQRYGAKLMVDEAHATGVLGRTGRGLEEHFDLPRSADILMGTFSKAPGTTGGYVCGSRELIYYLRFYARSAMFSAAPPAALCAGVTEAFRVMQEFPELREALWANVHYLAEGLQQLGFSIPRPQSPIVPVFVGSSRLLRQLSCDLFSLGIKCGSVGYPAVPHGKSILRLTLNARHTREDLDRALDVFGALGNKYGLLHRAPGEATSTHSAIVSTDGIRTGTIADRFATQGGPRGRSAKAAAAMPSGLAARTTLGGRATVTEPGVGPGAGTVAP